MRSPQSVANTRRFFARSNAPHAQANYSSNRMQYSAACYAWDRAHADATPAERDQAHRAIANRWRV